MLKLIFQSLRLTLVFTVLTGLLYPLAVTGVAQLAFRDKANGSLIERDGKMIGSELLAQPFTDARYFWPRPSAGGYAAVPSGASNLGPTSAALQSNVVANAKAFRDAHHLAADVPVPSDMVFTSASGLDPHISPAAARIQISRVAAARGIPADTVLALVERSIELPQLGFLGEPRVNVLMLNLALNQQQ
ncbi:MAG: potassium-transporting ATPase subunit KdpC [Kiritimatiellaceae bacterium]|nr:potassium-transporting ATPase subunit KdpC [Kiritimatiellaceae bacterium]